MAEFEARAKKFQEMNDKLEKLRRATLNSQRQQLVRTLFSFVKDKRTGDIQDLLRTWVLQIGLEASLLQSNSQQKNHMWCSGEATGPGTALLPSSGKCRRPVERNIMPKYLTWRSAGQCHQAKCCG